MSEANPLYAELHRCIQKNDFDKVIKTANKVLHSNHDDVKAFQCKIVALINLDRFEEALTAFAKFPDFTKQLLYEKAYCLYRLNRIEDALKVIESAPDKNKLNFKELKAQICYRQEKFEECYDLYKSLVKQTADEYDDERKTNYTANIAQLASHGQIIDISSFCPERNSAESYEILFNTACYLLYLHQYDEAEAYLSEAEKQCIDSFDDDTPQDEVDSELNVIKTQLACCKHLQKKESQALNIYSGVLDKKPTDYGVVAVASNNILSVNKNKNVFEIKKKMKVLLSDPVMSKLTTPQKRTVVTNINQINALSALTMDEALKICDKLLKEHPENIETVVLLKASILMKFKNLNAAIDVLEEHLKTSTGSKLKMGLAMAQLYLNMGKYENACQILKSLGEDMFRPGVVSALVTIMIALGDTAGASTLLESAVEWNKNNKRNTAELSALWQHAADLHLKRGQSKLALHCLEELLKIKPNDFKVLSKLTLVYTKMNHSKAFVFCEEIKDRVDLTPHLDVNQLESSRWMMGLKTIKKVAKADQSPGTPFIEKKNKKCHSTKKKKRLPKNYDPTVAPDPERWLPKRERSYFKKKKDRRNKDIGKGTQGASSSTADQYDITKMSSHNKDKTPQPIHTDEHKPQTRKMQQRKKKKGGRW